MSLYNSFSTSPLNVYGRLIFRHYFHGNRFDICSPTIYMYHTYSHWNAFCCFQPVLHINVTMGSIRCFPLNESAITFQWVEFCSFAGLHCLVFFIGGVLCLIPGGKKMYTKDKCTEYLSSKQFINKQI